MHNTIPKNRTPDFSTSDLKTAYARPANMKRFRARRKGKLYTRPKGALKTLEAAGDQWHLYEGHCRWALKQEGLSGNICQSILSIGLYYETPVYLRRDFEAYAALFARCTAKLASGLAGKHSVTASMLAATRDALEPVLICSPWSCFVIGGGDHGRCTQKWTGFAGLAQFQDSALLSVGQLESQAGLCGRECPDKPTASPLIFLSLLVAKSVMDNRKVRMCQRSKRSEECA